MVTFSREAIATDGSLESGSQGLSLPRIAWRKFWLVLACAANWIGSSAAYAQETEAYLGECGPACLYVCLIAEEKAPERFTSLMHQANKLSNNGSSMAELAELSRHYGLEAVPAKGSFEHLKQFSENNRVIALLSPGHYVVADVRNAVSVAVFDPPQAYELSRSEFEKNWTGNMLVLGAIEERTPQRWRVLALGMLCMLTVGGAVIFLSKRRAC